MALRRSVALFGGLAPPGGVLTLITRQTDASGVFDAEGMLRRGLAPFRTGLQDAVVSEQDMPEEPANGVQGMPEAPEDDPEDQDRDEHEIAQKTQHGGKPPFRPGIVPMPRRR